MIYFPARVLQKRWKNLRDCYTRELFRIVKVKANGTIDRKKGYVFFKQLSFLKKVIKPTTRTSEISANELEALKNELEREDSAPDNNNHLEDMEVSEDEFQDYNTLPVGVSEDDFNIQPNYTVNIEDIFTSQSTSTSRQSKSVDCDTLFLISLARDLQEIPEERKLDVKIELLQVLKLAKKRKSSRILTQTQYQQRKLVVKNEAESESLDDTDEQSRDSIRDLNSAELLEKNDV